MIFSHTGTIHLSPKDWLAAYSYNLLSRSSYHACAFWNASNIEYNWRAGILLAPLEGRIIRIAIGFETCLCTSSSEEIFLAELCFTLSKPLWIKDELAYSDPALWQR